MSRLEEARQELELVEQEEVSWGLYYNSRVMWLEHRRRQLEWEIERLERLAKC